MQVRVAVCRLLFPVLAASHRMVINEYRDAVHSMAWGLVATLGLTTHLNRLVRTRMLGGVQGARSNPGPYADYCSRCFMEPGTTA